MKRQILIGIMFFLIFCSCNHKNLQNNETSDTVDSNMLSIESILGGDSVWAEKEFITDTSNGLMLICYGLPSNKDVYYWDILKYNYGIEKKLSLGCTISEGVPYYNDLMKRKIKKKFGDNFFDIVETKVDSIFKIDNALIEKVKRSHIFDTSQVVRYMVFNTPDINIKVVSGYGRKLIQDKPWNINLFRASIDRRNLKIIDIDTIPIGEEPSIN